jgi:hypothetical protein
VGRLTGAGRSVGGEASGGGAWRVASIVRTLVVSSSATLVVLHRALLACFGWSGDRQHVFAIRAVLYAACWQIGAEDGRDVALASLGLRAGEQFTWSYDFLDGWGCRRACRGRHRRRGPVLGSLRRGAKVGALIVVVRARGSRELVTRCCRFAPSVHRAAVQSAGRIGSAHFVRRSGPNCGRLVVAEKPFDPGAEHLAKAVLVEAAVREARNIVLCDVARRSSVLGRERGRSSTSLVGPLLGTYR